MSWIVRSFPSSQWLALSATLLRRIHQLYTAKAKTAWRRSESLLTRLIVNTIGTGLAVAGCGLLILVLFITASESSQQFLLPCVRLCARPAGIV